MSYTKRVLALPWARPFSSFSRIRCLRSPPSPQQPTGQALIARGEYLTIAADCAACRTSRGGKPFAGGLPFKLPFGTIYSSNITTDNDHGIGSWTDAEFVRQ